MTKEAKYVPSKTTLCDAAKMMSVMDCGFLPIGDSERGKLKGVITDRDIITRGLAEECDPKKTTVAEIMTDKVLYCYENEDIEDAVESMRKQHVYRLIVLDNRDNKHMTGIVTLGDIVQEGHYEELAGKTVREITSSKAA
jgi:CBS domain-containing protein